MILTHSQSYLYCYKLRYSCIYVRLHAHFTHRQPIVLKYGDQSYEKLGDKYTKREEATCPVLRGSWHMACGHDGVGKRSLQDRAWYQIALLRLLPWIRLTRMYSISINQMFLVLRPLCCHDVHSSFSFSYMGFIGLKSLDTNLLLSNLDFLFLQPRHTSFWVIHLYEPLKLIQEFESVNSTLAAVTKQDSTRTPSLQSGSRASTLVGLCYLEKVIQTLAIFS